MVIFGVNFIVDKFVILRFYEETELLTARKNRLIMTHKSEQNTALKKQVRLLTGQFTSTEQRLMDLNGALVTSQDRVLFF